MKLPGADKRLRIFKADLCEEGSFDAAVAGCQGLFHVAAPVDPNPNDPENEVIKVGIKGTLDVLESCRKTGSVKRVVLMSSFGALFWKEEDDGTNYLDESSSSDVDFLRRKKPPAWAYWIAKTESEKAALEFGRKNGMEVATLIPPLVVGRWITPSVPESVLVATSLLTGHPGVVLLKAFNEACVRVELVHVDDVCSACVFVYETQSSIGRHVCCPVGIDLPALARRMRERYPDSYVGPTDFDCMGPTGHVTFSCRKLTDMGFRFQYTDVDSMMDETVKCMRVNGLIP
eukprot:TRINITY_DN1996_c0_g1_i1.p1 TRINITY_DN1996_c0_g1~~TRINITY_DN1996_c0_g1_i1.p1  ORF type:complete len:288 (+),score=10.54 TRINITY_DN1996_c0_g1_i1:441-1304(+)